MLPANLIPQGLVRFGLFRLDLAGRKLYRDGMRVKLQGQSLRILELLLQRPREIVTREELIADLWPGSIHVNFDAGLNTAIKNLRAALGDSAENPRFIETLPLRGYRFIAPIEVESQAAAPEPQKPFPDLEGVLDPSPEILGKSAGVRSRMRILIAVLAAVSATVLGLGLAAFRIHKPSDAPQINPVAARRSVAIVGFKNLSRRAGQDWIATVLAEELTAELGASEDLRTVPGESVSRMKRDLLLPDTESYAKDTLLRVREYLGTDYIVAGSYFEPLKRPQDDVRVDVRLQDTMTGETVAAVTETGTEAELSSLVSRMGTTLRQKLGLGMLSSAQSGFVRATLPSGLQAVHLYCDGLIKLRALEMERARDLLARAVEAEPTFPLAHSALAESWSALGFEENAKAEAAQAFHLSARLSRQDQFFIQAFYFEINHDWDNAIKTYQTLFNFFPDNLEYGLRLAHAQSTAGKGKEALATVEALKKFPLPSREDPRIDLAEARAAKSLGDYSHERTAAASAGVKATAQGSRLEIAEARLEEGGALDDLGQPNAAVALEGEAKTIFAATGDQGGVARALNDLGHATLHQGNLVAAGRMFSESSELAQKIGNRRLLATSLNNVAIVHYQQGNLAEAARVSQQAADRFREVGDRNAVATSLNNIAVILTDLGDLSAAQQKYEESLTIAREIGDSDNLARTLSNLARLLTREGELGAAEERYQESLRAVGSGREHSYAVQGLGDVFFWRGDLKAAQKKYEDALHERTEIHDDELAAESRMMIAQVLVRQGSFRQAQEKAQEAIDEFRKAGNGDEEAESEAILARALLGQAMPKPAQEMIEHAASIAAKSEDRDVHLSVGIESARIKADIGNAQAAIPQLESAMSEAKKYHYAGYQLDAARALGEIELKGREPAKGRALLLSVVQEATAKGFGLIADAAKRQLREEHGGHKPTVVRNR